MNKYTKLIKGQGEKHLIQSELTKFNIKTKSAKHSKGFTLVELIVVLVIIAILAGVAVPLMLGFVDNSREKQYIDEAKIALTSSQTLLSDVYTDGLDYVPWYMRDQAFKTSGLAVGTEFIIWTKENFDQKADGTYNSIAAYTVDKALYKTENGGYVYYTSKTSDSKESWVYVADLSEVSGFDETGKLTDAGNLIVVWPSNSQFAKDDTARSGNKADATDESGNVIIPSKEDEKEQSSNFSNEKNKDNIDGSEGSHDVTKIKVNFYGFTNSKNKDVVYFSKEATSETSRDRSFYYDSMDGFSSDDDYSSWTRKIDDNYDSTKLKWTFEIANTDYISNQEQFEAIDKEWDDSSISTNLISLIKCVKNEAEINLRASIEQRYYDIPLLFKASNPDTLNVDVAEDSDETVILHYGRGENDISYIFDEVSTDTTVSAIKTEDVSVISADPTRKIKFYDDPVVDGKWKITTTQDEGGELALFEPKKTGELSSSLSSYISGLGEEERNTKLEALQIAGINITAYGNIYKKLYIQARDSSSTTTENPNLVAFSLVMDNSGEGNELSENTLSEDKKTVTIELSVEEENEKKYIYKQETNEQGDVIDVPIDEFEEISGYSLFNIVSLDGSSKTTDKLVNINTSNQHVMYWYIYDCQMENGEKLDENEEIKTRKWDISEKILTQLFETNKDSDAECAELDAATFRTLFEVYSDHKYIKPDEDWKNKNTPVSGYLDQLAGGPGGTKYDYKKNIRSIKYIKRPSVGENGYRDVSAGFQKEICLSSTKLVREDNTYLKMDDDGNYVIDETKFDEEYPAYTIGYSVKVNNNLYDIYIFSDIVDMDDAVSQEQQIQEFNSNDIYCKGNMINLFRGCKNMTSIELLDHMDTSGVESFWNMFKECEKLSTIDVSHFKYDSAIVLDSMFNGATGLKEIRFSNSSDPITCENIKRTAEMFNNCQKLEKLVNFNIYAPNNYSVKKMFMDCASLKTVELPYLTVTTCTEPDNINRKDFAELMFGKNVYKNDFKLETIYVSDQFVIPDNLTGNVFNDKLVKLVGGNGTTLNTTKLGKDYARIDAPGTPGYFTNIDDKPTEP